MPRDITRYTLRVLNSENSFFIDLVQLRIAGGNAASTLYLTNGGEQVTWGGNTYLPINFSRSEINEILSSEQGQEPSITLTFTNVDGRMAEMINSVPLVGSKLKLWAHDRRRIVEKPTRTRDAILLVDGEVRNPVMTENQVTFDVQNIIGMIDSITVPNRVYSTNCTLTFMSPSCGASGASPNRVETTAQAGTTRDFIVVPSTVTDLAGSTDPTIYWRNGYVVMIDGVGALQSRPISRVATVSGQKRFYFRYPLPTAPSTGDAAMIVRGCGRTKADCIQRQGDADNFGGFEEIPAEIVPRIEKGDV